MLAYKTHTTWRGGISNGGRAVRTQSPPWRPSGSGAPGLSGPRPLAEPRPLGLGASPPSGSRTAPVPASHPG